MTCVDFDGLFMLKKVICIYNEKAPASSFNERLMIGTHELIV